MASTAGDLNEQKKRQAAESYKEGCGPGCEGCPKCGAKEKMVAMGYSEEAIEKVLPLLESRYGERPGLWENIHRKRDRIKRGSGERMRKPGSKGAPSAADIKSAGADDE